MLGVKNFLTVLLHKIIHRNIQASFLCAICLGNQKEKGSHLAFPFPPTLFNLEQVRTSLA